MLSEPFIASIQAAWSADTASDNNSWSPANPAAGHCDVTSLVVRERYGGDLRHAEVSRNGEPSEHHYWNVLLDGAVIDLTSEQFDGAETFGPVTEMDQAFFDNAGPMNDELLDRLSRFRSTVDAQLSNAARS